MVVAMKRAAPVGVPLYRDLVRKGEADLPTAKRPAAKGRQRSEEVRREWPGSNVRPGPGVSARRLAATRVVDLFLEGLEADRADHHVGADHVARRAVHPERLGDLVALLERCLDLVARKVLLDAPDIETDLLGDRQRTCLVDRSAAAEQLLVELEIFLAAG